MTREANEIREKHIAVDKSEVFFKRDEQNKTLSAYLRDEGLSALIFDTKKNVIGTYGLYSGLINSSPIEKLAKKTDLDRVLIEGKTFFGFYKLHENRNHLVLFYPILEDSEVVGALSLSSDLNFGKNEVLLLISTLIFVLTISIICGWIFTHWMITRQFRPLIKILNKLNDYELGREPDNFEILGNPNDELVKLSKALNQMMQRVHEGATKQRDFISNAAHELKTPLANSVLSLDIAENNLIDKKYSSAKDSVQVVRADLKKYGDLINSLLELAKIESLTTHPNELRLGKLIKEVVGKAKNIKVEIENGVRLFFPENQMRIILNNLIGNALKYSKKGSLVHLNISSKNNGEIVVENEVANLKNRDLAKIWQRHQRLEGTKKIHGNGIGLSLVKEVANHHDLKIAQELKIGKFRIVVFGFNQ